MYYGDSPAEYLDDQDHEDERPPDFFDDTDAITTTDHIHFYQYGKLAFRLAETEDTSAGIQRNLDLAQFWPDVFFISDHGNQIAINYWE